MSPRWGLASRSIPNYHATIMTALWACAGSNDEVFIEGNVKPQRGDIMVETYRTR